MTRREHDIGPMSGWIWDEFQELSSIQALCPKLVSSRYNYNVFYLRDKKLSKNLLNHMKDFFKY